MNKYFSLLFNCSNPAWLPVIPCVFIRQDMWKIEIELGKFSDLRKQVKLDEEELQQQCQVKAAGRLHQEKRRTCLLSQRLVAAERCLGVEAPPSSLGGLVISGRKCLYKGSSSPEAQLGRTKGREKIGRHTSLSLCCFSTEKYRKLTRIMNKHFPER